MYSTAARSIIRSAPVRNGAARLLGSAPKPKPNPARSPFQSSTRKPLSARLFSCPVEMCSMQPYHTATASALMTSMLTLSRVGYGWLPEVAQFFVFKIESGVHGYTVSTYTGVDKTR